MLSCDKNCGHENHRKIGVARLLITLIVSLHLLLPIAAWAQSNLRNPLSVSLREYGFFLGLAVLGGVASWWSKVRRGELPIWNISAFIGELVISAFAGLMAFFLCEYMSFNTWLSAAVVGMSGHAGAKGIGWLESFGQRMAEKKLGIDNASKDAP